MHHSTVKDVDYMAQTTQHEIDRAKTNRSQLVAHKNGFELSQTVTNEQLSTNYKLYLNRVTKRLKQSKSPIRTLKDSLP